MDNTAENLIGLISDLEEQILPLQKDLEATKKELRFFQFRCKHNWKDPERKSKYHEGGYDPGDPPGTMGVDRRPPCSYPSTEDVWYERVCSTCGKVETTTRTESTGLVKPVF